ncbi:hypothetical protein [Lentzea sp.]|uniref:hypothetical protein n=1 Tax=Lentzea sp. TaxID=56099 RepID=UPI002ED0ED8E
MNANTTSGSRWEPAAAAVPPPAAPVPPPPPPPAPAARPRGFTGPVVAGALGLAVLTGLGGFALGLAAGDDTTSQVRQDSGQLPDQQGQFPGGRQGRGDGQSGTLPDDGSTGQGT